MSSHWTNSPVITQRFKSDITLSKRVINRSNTRRKLSVSKTSGYEVVTIAGIAPERSEGTDVLSDLDCASGQDLLKEFEEDVSRTGTVLSIDGLALGEAQFTGLVDVFVKDDGTIIVSESSAGGSGKIKQIKDGVVTTIAGSGRGFQNGPALSAKFNNPKGIFCASNGDIYIADSGNNCIRMFRDDQVYTIAGTGHRGDINGPCGQACFNQPSDICVDRTGTLLVADAGNSKIRAIRNGMVETIAGFGRKGHCDDHVSLAMFRELTQICAMDDGRIIVVDQNRIKQIEQGYVRTIAGGGRGYKDGDQNSALFSNCRIFGNQHDDSVIISDQKNHCIRMLRDGVVSTIAGTGKTHGYQDGVAEGSLFSFPMGVGLTVEGDIIVLDSGNHVIRKIRKNKPLPFTLSTIQFVDDLYLDTDWTDCSIGQVRAHYSIVQSILPQILKLEYKTLLSTLSNLNMEYILKYIYNQPYDLSKLEMKELFSLWNCCEILGIEILCGNIRKYLRAISNVDNILLICHHSRAFKLEKELGKAIRIAKDSSPYFESLNLTGTKADAYQFLISKSEIDFPIEYIHDVIDISEENYSDIYIKRLYPDIILIVTDIDGKVDDFSLHKYILARRSGYFRNLFTSDTETVDISINIPMTAFNLIINEIYSAFVTPKYLIFDEIEDALELYLKLDQFELDGNIKQRIFNGCKKSITQNMHYLQNGVISNYTEQMVEELIMSDSFLSNTFSKTVGHFNSKKDFQNQVKKAMEPIIQPLLDRISQLELEVEHLNEHLASNMDTPPRKIEPNFMSSTSSENIHKRDCIKKTKKSHVPESSSPKDDYMPF
eukprot:TRINITY_DN7991_c0_g1_i1.p1 TRINITY_DN7991_c0_g1~~TRINITY_DN7991_c0_g1_i1.p1  ORF type:complete len:827 (-),score=126.33 TRINITY_DN7991_c0_g1_i1:102-2582(-)